MKLFGREPLALPKDGLAVIVADWRGQPKGYRLFPESGAYERWPNKDLPSGLGCSVRIGGMPSVKAFAAIYASDNRLWFQFGERRFDLCNDRRIVVNGGLFSRKKLQVLHAGDYELCVTYPALFAELREWPTPGHIFNYAAEITRSEREIREVLARWTANKPRLERPSPIRLD